MYCKNCGRQITDGSRFCPFCGKDPAGAAALAVRRTPVSKSWLDTVVVTIAGLLCIVGLVVLIGTLAASGRIKDSVSATVASLSGLTGMVGFDLMEVPGAATIISAAQSAMARVATFVTFTAFVLFLALLLLGLLAFLVVAIDRKVTDVPRPAPPEPPAQA